ncbi:uncharacterized protein LOC124542091 [Vanessa cardui]|uniref:uncharacterized protein LOC124542091 n=1 Tax=Vanessa cardui TaxID=171605 RepID=UPI001F140388|nr:uncharacterized protein LOC124542091 [Vanessa cardui]
MNQLIDGISKSSVGCHIDGVCVNNISYADDMVLLSPSIGAIRQLLKMCELYAEAHGLKYNAKKSEVLVFKSGAKGYCTIPTISLCGSPLRRVTSFKYLGHWVTQDLRDNADIDRERRYGMRAYSDLRVQYNNALRMLLGLPWRYSASNMFAEWRIDGFKAIMRSGTQDSSDKNCFWIRLSSYLFKHFHLSLTLQELHFTTHRESTRRSSVQSSSLRAALEPNG